MEKKIRSVETNSLLLLALLLRYFVKEKFAMSKSKACFMIIQKSIAESFDYNVEIMFRS